MNFNPGFPIEPTADPLGFRLGKGTFDRGVERRTLDSIRSSLRDPNCAGPEVVYAIMMDMGRREHIEALKERMLLYGAVAYAAGRLGDEPIRSQGHIHKMSRSGWSTPEVYEIWDGAAVIYMQELPGDDPGRCFAVHAGPGGVVVVPPGWTHATVSADSARPLAFGAWCVRDYGFEYADVRAHGGIAWFPLLDESGALQWAPNPAYRTSELIRKRPEPYPQLGICLGVPIYEQFARDHDRFLFVSNPALKRAEWEGFVP